MRKLFISCLLLIVCGFSTIKVYAQELLTNQSLIEMVELGFSSEVIISKIKTSKTNFDTSLEALKALKDKGIESAVLAEIIQANKVEKTGIYYVDALNKEHQILPTNFSGTKTRTLASGLTYGIASAKVKSIINNASSNNVMTSSTPEFTFCFVPFNNNQISVTDWWFRATQSPAEFVLVKLNVNAKKNNRDIEVGKVNLWVGADSGIKNENVIRFSIEDLGNGAFKVRPEKSLESGEYCFFFQGQVPQGGNISNQSIFDFSIK